MTYLAPCGCPWRATGGTLHYDTCLQASNATFAPVFPAGLLEDPGEKALRELAELKQQLDALRAKIREMQAKLDRCAVKPTRRKARHGAII